MKKQMQLVRCTVNGREVEEYVDVRESLLDMLRNRLGLTSVKKGCEVGECGACTVIIDGETIDSCIYLAVWAEGKNIRTLEGLEKNGELTRIQEAFIEEGAIQCGFCTPGFIMSATVLLEHGEKLSRVLIPLILLLLGKGSVEHGSYRLLITFHYGIYVFRTTGTAFNLEDVPAVPAIIFATSLWRLELE